MSRIGRCTADRLRGGGTMSAWRYVRDYGRRRVMKIGAASALVGLPATSGAVAAVPKIALEEHFSMPELEQRGLVARPARLHPMWTDIGRRLVDLGDLRLEAMDAAGIDLSVLSLTLPGIQGEKEQGAAVRLARQANDFL